MANNIEIFSRDLKPLLQQTEELEKRSEGMSFAFRKKESPEVAKKSNVCGRVLSKISDWAEDHPKTVKALKYSAIALLVLTILGGALLAYMHFSGLGISKAGFVQLGHQISNLANKAWTKFIDAMKAPAHLNIGEVIGIAAGSALGGVLAVAAGVGIKKACDKRKQQNQVTTLFDEFQRAENEEISRK
jgi:hypothetical protein